MAELTARPAPTPDQHAAADPSCSVWVNASAGTGKTRVLANRMLRLLLAGADPGGILCLTFTKAGAAEMAARIQHDLRRFATLDDCDLQEELEGLLGVAPSSEEIDRARLLLAGVLDLPAGLRIMTIHGFCQALLHRFPLEANVVPHFEVLEPRAATELMRMARDEALIATEPGLPQAVAKVAVALGERSFSEALDQLNARRSRLKTLIDPQGGIDQAIDQINARLGLTGQESPAGIIQETCDDPAIHIEGLALAAEALALGKEKDQACARIMASWLAADPQERARQFADYQGVFFTSKGEPRKKLATEAVQRAFFAAKDILHREQARLEAFSERRKAAVIAERSAAVLRVGAAIIRRYENAKAARAFLDYDDLIEQSLQLLTTPGMAPWVQYKLDQGIDHLLIDEAQDTSPDQWAIIQALVEDQFSGESAARHLRTLFVVGDEKQSIFAFQGADLETFQRLRRDFAARAAAARLPWRETPLDQSFRSAPAILQAVDAVFAPDEVRAGVATGAMRHQPFHPTAPGVVEIWPLIKSDPPPKAEAWTLPDNHGPWQPPERRIAQAIATQVRRWFVEGEHLPGQGRAITPGDIMILLPRRGVIQDLLIRCLKHDEIPVAGTDRLALIDELAVHDLMALGDALLLPEDDLTLAALLRSPLFGLSEDDLFMLAYERQAPLYQRLHDLRHENVRIAAADELFTALRSDVDFSPPFEFYARFLGAGGGRRRLIKRLGDAAREPIEAFLAQALAYERNHPPSLQGFLHWLRGDSSDVVRDPDQPRNEVRVLTVHGSKGLEAPIVILPDTTCANDGKRDRILWHEDGLPFWRMPEAQQDKVTRAIDRSLSQRAAEERRRLLYVALTRARERVIVAGWERKRGKESCWYSLIDAARARLSGASETNVSLGNGESGAGWRYGSSIPTIEAPDDRQSPKPSVQDDSLPAWLYAPAPAHLGPLPLRPSQGPLEDAPPAASPLNRQDERRFGRGRLIHRLLQVLPSCPLEQREARLQRHLAKPGLNLEPAMQAEIAGQLRMILEHPDFAPLFGPGSLAEAPIIGQLEGVVINGQVDRLVVLDDRVMVVDYKTNRPPPQTASHVPMAYRRQMAAYRALLQQIFPEHQISCALLWTEGPNLMELYPAMLDLPGGPEQAARVKDGTTPAGPAPSPR